MPVFHVVTDLMTTRSYEVWAEDSEAAETLVRNEFGYLSFDLIDEEILGVSIEADNE